MRLVEDKDDEEQNKQAQGDRNSVANYWIVVGVVDKLSARIFSQLGWLLAVRRILGGRVVVARPWIVLWLLGGRGDVIRIILVQS